MKRLQLKRRLKNYYIREELSMRKKIIAFLMFIFTILSFVLTSKVVTNAANVPINLAPWDIVNCWDGEKVWTTEGAKIILPGGVPDAWNRRADVLNNNTYGPLFDISKMDKVSFKFSIGLFGTDGTIISKSNNSTAIDILVMNASNDQEIMLLRIWTDSGSWNNGNHSYEIYPIYNNWDTKVYGSNWIKGDATLSSEFFIQFSKENLFESYVGGSDTITRLDDENNTLLNYRYRLDGVERIYFRIAGDNGFSANTDIIIKEINGQSLENDGNNFNDTVSPVIFDRGVSATIPYGEEYTLNVDAYDLLSSITYRVETEEGTVLNPNGKSFTPNTLGTYSVVLVATDAAGNEARKTFTFNVTSEITPPILENVPTLTDLNVDYFDIITFDAPTVIDETGVYTLRLHIYTGETVSDDPILTLPIKNDKFTTQIPANFTSGNYTLVYEATNEIGSTTSTPQTIMINVGSVYSNTFIEPNNKYGLADYVPDGVRLRTTGFTWFELGTFEMKYGFDIKFKVPTNEKITNDALSGYVEVVLADPNNLDLHVMYRVWVQISGPDNPTNIYIKYPDQNYIDLTDAGWISKTVDGIQNHFHMAFDSENYFIGERTSGMVNADRGQQEIKAFLETVGHTKLTVFLASYSLGDKNYFETIITEINGQSLKSTNGVINDVKDATLIVEDVDAVALINEKLTFPVYVYDLFNPELTYTVKVTTPTDEELVFSDLSDAFTFTPEELGSYTFTFTTTGVNGKEIKVTKEVLVKSKITLPTIILNGSYKSNYNHNETITILSANYSEDIQQESIKITIQKPNGQVIEVKSGDSFTFTLPGIYRIVYSAKDAAEPEPNEVTLTYLVNVPDETKPVVELETELPTRVELNKEIELPQIIVTDDSECSIEVVLTKPNGQRMTLQLVNGKYKLNLNEIGTWKVTITVTDLYDNATTLNYDILVVEPKSNTGLIIGIIIGSAIIVIGAVVLFIRLKKR